MPGGDEIEVNEWEPCVELPHDEHKNQGRASVDWAHYSLLAAVEDLNGVGRLGNAVRAAPMGDLPQS